jgi:hypothetical protein
MKAGIIRCSTVMVASASVWIDHLRAHRPGAEFSLADRLENQPAGSGRNLRQKRTELKALEEIFRFKVLTTLRAEGSITYGIIEKLMA